MTTRIEDYALIGDCRTAALVGRDGSIDWLCLPRFDSPSCFARLLGTTDNGHWLIAPAGNSGTIERRYRDRSLVLETTFTTDRGSVRLVDFMSFGSPQSSIVRMVEGLTGSVTMQIELVIRFDYGITVPWVNRIDSSTWTAIAGPNLVVARSPVVLHGEGLRTVGEFSVKAGQKLIFSMTYGESHLPLPEVPEGDNSLRQTEKFWRGWSAGCKVPHPDRDGVLRSLLTLKALTYQPTGGMVAAVTTSLPELIGGVRNWDYRFCWLRDATFTLLAFMNAGFTDEANAWQHWLMRVIAGAPSQLQTLYGVAGERRLDEWEIAWLDGYEGSKPVRVGNAAAQQMQLDIYGELADVMEQSRRGGLPVAPRRSEIRKTFLEHLETIWRNPDNGIWEVRGEPQHFTHSKVMMWCAFDRATRSESADARDKEYWSAIARAIHSDVCEKGVDSDRNCFVQSYESKRMDASLLLLGLVGFLPANDIRLRNTVAEIEKHLLFEGFVRRYETETGIDGLPPGEGVFLACSFWLADMYVLLGRLEGAERLFEKLAGLANDVGLFAEEYDPRAQRMLGNFPQAFSHVALVNTALNIMHARQSARPPVQRHGEPPTLRHAGRNSRKS